MCGRFRKRSASEHLPNSEVRNRRGWLIGLQAMITDMTHLTMTLLPTCADSLRRLALCSGAGSAFSAGWPLTNARIETAAHKSTTMRRPTGGRRCIVPATAWDEWMPTAQGTTYADDPATGRTMRVCGLNPVR